MHPIAKDNKKTGSKYIQLSQTTFQSTSSFSEIKSFFNTSGLKYKELKVKDKLPQMTWDEKLNLLSSNGMLIKRPILITDTKVLLGFKEKEWTENLK